MRTKREIGQYYEEIAYQFFQNKGFKLIEKNSTFLFGEIDLIMQDKNCLVFIEVRYRQSSNYGSAQATITHGKQKRIIKAAYQWMESQNLNSEEIEYRFDVFAMTDNNIDWIVNAFSD